MAKVSASLLACDMAFLGQAVRELERCGADYLHLDVLDGHYVHNLSFGPKVVSDLKKVTSLPIEVHFELYRAENLIDVFAEAGTDRMIIQRDCCDQPIRLLTKIRNLGVKVGMAINPGDGIDGIEHLFHYLDFLSIMSVEPGFCGQTFEASCIEKVDRLKAMLSERNQELSVYMDGGITLEIAETIKKHDVDVMVVGNGLYNQGPLEQTIAAYRR
jgi:ribulose-phosphate 3-epimerase